MYCGAQVNKARLYTHSLWLLGLFDGLSSKRQDSLCCDFGLLFQFPPYAECLAYRLAECPILVCRRRDPKERLNFGYVRLAISQT